MTTTISLSEVAEAARQYWRGVLEAGDQQQRFMRPAGQAGGEVGEGGVEGFAHSE